MPTTCTPASCVITGDVCDARVALFNGHKINVFNAYHPGRPENTEIVLTYDQFINLMQPFYGPNYSGVRIYFACYATTQGDTGNGDFDPKNDVDKLTLIFAPTKFNNTTKFHDDDQTMYYTLVNGAPVHLPNPTTVATRVQDTASNWVRHYQHDLIPLLQADGGNYTNNPKNYAETKSLWYPWYTIYGIGSDPGLIGYASCMHNTPPTPAQQVDGVIILFGCFVPNEGTPYPWYQLTLIFDLHQVGDGPLFSRAKAVRSSTTLSFASTPARDKKGKLHPFMDQPTDTGFPCPPDTGCNGITLPAS